MTIDFTAKELEVTLVPFGKDSIRRAGRGLVRHFTVHPEFGNPKTRFVQGVADKVGGRILYLEAWLPGGNEATNVLAVPMTRGSSMNGGGTSEGELRYAADFAANTVRLGGSAVAVGQGRTRWLITTKAREHSTRDANDIDQAAVESADGKGPFRKEF